MEKNKVLDFMEHMSKYTLFFYGWVALVDYMDTQFWSELPFYVVLFSGIIFFIIHIYKIGLIQGLKNGKR